MKLKLLYIITRFDLGGAQKSLLDLAVSLPKDKYEIVIACGNGGILLDDALKLEGVRASVIPSLRREIIFFSDIKALIELRSFIKSQKADIVHTHSSKAGIIGRWAAKLAGVPVIMHSIHGWEFYRGQNPVIRNFYVFLERLTAPITDKLIAVSNYDIEEGLKERIGVREKYALIRYGIRRGEFYRPGSHSSDLAVGMLACFKPQKSPQDFIRAAGIVVKEVPSVKFFLIGDGVLRAKIERLIKKLELNGNVRLLGWRRDIAQLLTSFDILVLTSRWEGLPLVLLEAMAAGRPIIASDVCGNHEIIRDGENGFLFPRGDYEALAQKIILLIKNDKLRCRLGSKGRELLDDTFESGHMAGCFDRLYTGLTNTQR